MSTPDNPSRQHDDLPSAPNGVNAWKFNPTRLTTPQPTTPEPDKPSGPPPPSAGPEKTERTQPVPPPEKKGKRLMIVGLLVFGLSLGLRGLYPFVSPSPKPEPSVVPQTRSTNASPAPSTTDAAQASASLPAYRALVIGINRYKPSGSEGWPLLQTARADAESVARVLSSDYGFQVQTLLDADASRANILSALDDMATSGTDGADLIYFAGHGYYDEKLQEGYWIPADARKTVEGREAKEEWLWNSMLTRLISASHARHVLILSDACYSGSLFRGDQPLGDRSHQAWYERAIAKPSRYLITSGGIEPVLDSGIGHSVFAQQVLNYLQNSDQAIFSANDLGSALRERVAALTGQMVQMGPLPVSGHAGGEFVFVRQKDGHSQVAFTPQPTTPSPQSQETRGGTDKLLSAPEKQSVLKDALELSQAGAIKSANSLVATLLKEDAQSQLARAVADYVSRSKQQEKRDELQKLIAQIASKAKASSDSTSKGSSATTARPRVLACLGPTVPSGAASAESLGLLYRIALRSSLEQYASFRIIEREALESILQEQNLGVSDLADARARTAIGKILPASLLLLGDVIPSTKSDKIFLRLVDTETTQVLGSFNATCQTGEDPESVYTNLAKRIADRVVSARPLLAPVTAMDGKNLRAAIGTFQGAHTDMKFNVVTRAPRDKKSPDDLIEKTVGQAILDEVSELSSEGTAEWTIAPPPSNAKDLWLREAPEVSAAR